MEKFIKYATIEGTYFDCQLALQDLLLWDLDGSLSFFPRQGIEALKKRCHGIIPNKDLKTIIKKQADVPGKALPVDTLIMDGSLYTATEEGLFRGVERHQQLWDLRLFNINKNIKNRIIALSGGEEGLFELNLSAFDIKGLKLAEKGVKDIYQIPSVKSYYASYDNENLNSSFSDSNIFSIFYQKDSIREYIDSLNPYSDNIYIPKGFVVDNGVAYKQNAKSVSFIRLDKSQSLGYQRSVDADAEQLGRVIDVTSSKLHTEFQFDNGLLFMNGDNELLRIAEPVTKWRSFYDKKEECEYLIVLLDNRVEIYTLSYRKFNPQVQEPNSNKRHSITARDVIRQVMSNYSCVTDGEEACNLLNTLIKRLEGGLNIDFIDGDNWDRLFAVYYDKATKLMYFVKQFPQKFETCEEEQCYRMVWRNIDVFATVVRFNELRLLDIKGYPFVVLRTSKVLPSIISKSIKAMVGDIKGKRQSIYGQDYAALKDGKNWYIRCFNNNLENLLLLGKDTMWSSTNSCSLLFYDNVNLIKKELWQSYTFFASSIDARFFRDNKKILFDSSRRLINCFRLLMTLDMAAHNVYESQEIAQQFEDDFECIKFIERLRNSEMTLLREARSISDFLFVCDSIENYKSLHADMVKILLAYIHMLEAYIHKMTHV